MVARDRLFLCKGSVDEGEHSDTKYNENERRRNWSNDHNLMMTQKDRT